MGTRELSHIEGVLIIIVHQQCCPSSLVQSMFMVFLNVSGQTKGGKMLVYMAEQHGTTAAVITGSSTHNERIEHLWRDVYRCVASLFYNTFYSLEGENKLDPNNEIDLYCLHYVYLPRINLALQSFIESWNNHPVSTEGNLTPNQLFVMGALHDNVYLNFHTVRTEILLVCWCCHQH